MHRHLAKHSAFLSIWLATAMVAASAATVEARVRIPEKPSVEVNLGVLQHLSDRAPAFGAAPVDDIEAGELGAYRPKREHAKRKVPEENPYNPPAQSKKKSKHKKALPATLRRAPRAVAANASDDTPFYFGESPAARISSRPLPKLNSKKKPTAKPAVVKNVTPTPEPLPVVKVAKKVTPAPKPAWF